MSEIVHADITEAILGAAFEVHNTLGPGFLESIYEEALARELGLRGMAFQRQVSVPILYKNETVGTHVIDLIVDDQVIVELKAITELADIHKAVVLSYLAATKRKVALLINFGQPSLTFKRIVRQRINK
jgi:GxxExxY protein